MKFIPTRTCIACRKKGNKDNFYRVVKKGNQFTIDNQNSLFGRSYYICKNNECVEKTIKKKILNRVSKSNCPDEIYLNLKELICGKN